MTRTLTLNYLEKKINSPLKVNPAHPVRFILNEFRAYMQEVVFQCLEKPLEQPQRTEPGIAQVLPGMTQKQGM